ncbi:MAG: DUF84 family protein [Acidobacteria bacterium]|nr:MAG: DUF84 family protein [Acidobacteriota bacterium]
MNDDLKGFWPKLQSGVEVAVASNVPDKLLGVRDGFLRYFHDGLEQPVPVAVVPQPLAEDAELPLSDGDILALARRRAHALRERHGDLYAFYAASEAGFASFEAAGQTRHFVRSWTVLLGLGDEAWGASGSIELPQRLIRGLDDADLPTVVPATRRHGGMVSSLTGGLETRRSATALATLHALSSLFYGILESRPVRRRRRP